MMPCPKRRLRRTALACLGGTALLLMTACGANAGGPADPAASRSGNAVSAEEHGPHVTVTPGADATAVNPVAGVSVSADRGTLEQVSVTSDDGQDAAGELTDDGAAWTSSAPLEFDATYTVDYTAEHDGHRTSGESVFSTVDAAHEMDVSMNVEDGQTYGVWQVVEFDFSEPVAAKDEIEKAVTVSGGGDQKGAFRWYSDTTLRYRPEKPWAANSEVKVSIDLLGQDVGNAMIGNENETVSFRTGGEQRAYVDNDTKTLVAYVDGEKTGEWPVSLGNPEWPSTTGRKVIMEQAASYKFDPGSLGLSPGDPHYYEPFNATNTSRLTRSGEFVHQALPSALPLLGVSNVSHGCVGMPPEGAAYIFDQFRPGDMVEVVNTDYPQADPDDGYGDWNIPFGNYADESWHGDW